MQHTRCCPPVFTFLYYFDGNNNEADRIADRLIAARKNTRPTNGGGDGSVRLAAG